MKIIAGGRAGEEWVDLHQFPTPSSSFGQPLSSLFSFFVTGRQDELLAHGFGFWQHSQARQWWGRGIHEERKRDLVRMCICVCTLQSTDQQWMMTMVTMNEVSMEGIKFCLCWWAKSSNSRRGMKHNLCKLTTLFRRRRRRRSCRRRLQCVLSAIIIQHRTSFQKSPH